MGEEKVFWIDGWEGEKTDGCYYIYSPLKEFFEKLEEQGLIPVGIVCDGTYFLQILVKKQEGGNDVH